MRHIILVLIFVFGSVGLMAQQEAHYTHFMYNTLYLNPGVAGSKGHPSILALYRKQWIGFENAPDSKLVSFNAPIGKRVGFGLTIQNDQLGITNSWSGTMAYAYRVQLNEDTKVNVGIQGSMRYLGIDFSDPSVFILNSGDPSIDNNDLSRRYLGNFGAGVYLDYKQAFFGASVPNFFPNNISIDRAFGQAEETPHAYFMAGALIPLKSSNIALRPSALAKVVKNSPFDLDLNLSAVFNNSFIAGVSYRLGGDGAGESIDFLIHYRVNKIGLGLSYDYTLSDFVDYNNGSIEAIVVYDFVKERINMANPRFFF